MICNQCKDKEVTSKITEELCNSCYFENRKSKITGSSYISSIKEIVAITEIEDVMEESITNEYNNAAAGRLVEKEPEISLTLEEQDLCTEIAIENKPEELPIPEVELLEDTEVEKLPIITKDKVIQAPEDGKKYCQSCIERYGSLVLASREWTPNYFICDDCFTPLLNNQLGISNVHEVERIKTKIQIDNPALEQIYTLLETPEHLRFKNSEEVSINYNQFFNYHAAANVNKSLPELQTRIELLQTIFESIRQEIHPITDRINQLKYQEREKNQLNKVQGTRDGIKGPSKIKLSKLAKEAKAMGLSLEQYEKFIKETKQEAFDKIIKG